MRRCEAAGTRSAGRAGTWVLMSWSRHPDSPHGRGSARNVRRHGETETLSGTAYGVEAVPHPQLLVAGVESERRDAPAIRRDLCSPSTRAGEGALQRGLRRFPSRPSAGPGAGPMSCSPCSATGPSTSPGQLRRRLSPGETPVAGRKVGSHVIVGDPPCQRPRTHALTVVAVRSAPASSSRQIVSPSPCERNTALQSAVLP